MNLKKTIQYLGLVVVALQWGACENRGEATAVFKETVPERVSARSKELKDALEGAEFGWKALYFTDSLRLGGYSCLFKFKNGEVEMATDIDAEDTVVHKSQYDIVLGSTVSLLFSTRNTLHNLAQGDEYPEPYYKGQGWDGSFQWLYYGKEKEQLVFKTHRNFTEVRMVKATAEDWANFSKRAPLIKILKGWGVNKPIFRYLETTHDGKTNLYDFNYYSYTRFASTERPDRQPVSGYKGAVAYTPTGITLHPPLKVGNELLTDFAYDWASGTFNAAGAKGAKATIKWSTTPLIITDDYLDFIKEKMDLQFLWPIGKPMAQYAEYESDLGREIREKTSSKFDMLQNLGVQKGLEMLSLNFPPDKDNPDIGPNFIRWVSVIPPRIHFVLLRNVDVRADPVTKKIVFSPIGNLIYWSNVKDYIWSNPKEEERLKAVDIEVEKIMKEAVKEFEPYLYDPKGYYVRKGQFTVERLRNLDDFYTLSSAFSPFRLTLVADNPNPIQE